MIPSVGDWKSEEVATGLNNWILCMEMFILSVVHHFVFPYQQYTSNESYNLLNVKATVVNPVINFGSVIGKSDKSDLTHRIFRPKRSHTRHQTRVFTSEDEARQDLSGAAAGAGKLGRRLRG